MPELPEVETIARRLREVVIGKEFASVEILHPKAFRGEYQQLVGQTIDKIERRSKLLSFQLSGGDHLVTHLKMTGQLMYVTDHQRVGGGHPTLDWVQELPSNHTRIEYRFTDDSQLFFNDQRLLGWMWLMTPEQLQVEYDKLGPDITDAVVTPKYLFEQLQRRSIPIKVAIMTNQIVAGIGNIYACDALNVARISPFRPAKSLSESEVVTLLAACKQVIVEGVELGGTTFDGKYVHIDGMAGRYQEIARAYGRVNQDCPNCSAEIKKVKLAGRGTFYCGVCQK